MLITLSQKLINNNISNIAIRINTKIISEKKKSDIIIASLVDGLEVEVTSFPPV